MTDQQTQQTDEFDLWAGESGFKDDYDGVIVESFFTKSDRYNNGETLFLNLKLAADDGEEVEQMYPCGGDWDSYDNGETAEHPKDREGRPKTFNHQSAMFGLMSHAFASGAEEELRKRGTPREASIWMGLKFHWGVETTTFNMKDRKTGEMVERTTSRTYPNAFIGVFDVDSGTAATPASAPSTSAASPVTATPATSEKAAAETNGAAKYANVDPGIMAKLKIHAKSKAYGDFLDAALAVDGVTTDDALLGFLGEQEFYDLLRG